jgi:hypothetical protein
MLRKSKALVALCLALMATTIPAASFDDTVASSNLAEDDGTPQGRHRNGSVDWSTEPASGPGTRAGDLSLRAEAQVPDALSLTLTLRRNADSAVVASHIVTLEFHPVPGFAGSAVANVSGILMKAHLGARPLAARVVKLGERSFRIELSDDTTARTQNLQLIADAPWLDVIMTYANGRQAELMLIKGATGRQVFDRALASWN